MVAIEQEAFALPDLVCLVLQRFSMEGISNILQSGIRQTFGSSGTDKQVPAVPLLPASLLDSCGLASPTEQGNAGTLESSQLLGKGGGEGRGVLTFSSSLKEK